MGANHKIDQDIIFFDGVCNLCNGAVNFIIKRDHNRTFLFASLQSKEAHELIPNEAGKIDSIVLLNKEGKIMTRSNAALEIAKRLSGFWFLLYGFKVLPKFFRDAVYDIIARNRYKWFGRQNSCRIPTPDLQERFLEAF